MLQKHLLLLSPLLVTLLFMVIFRQSAQEQAIVGLGDPYYPLAGNPGYDVESYLIELEVDVDANFIAGSTTINAYAVDGLANFNLDFVGFTVQQVTVNDAPSTFQRDGAELIIFPPESIEAYQDFEGAHEAGYGSGITQQYYLSA